MRLKDDERALLTALCAAPTADAVALGATLNISAPRARLIARRWAGRLHQAERLLRRLPAEIHEFRESVNQDEIDTTLAEEQESDGDIPGQQGPAVDDLARCTNDRDGEEGI